MDIKRILRTMRHAQMEQRENPKTGERMVPPSVKFAVWFALILVAGALVWVGVAQFSAPVDDAGGALANDGGGPGGNNTTDDDPDAAMESDDRHTGPAPPASTDRVADV